MGREIRLSQIEHSAEDRQARRHSDLWRQPGKMVSFHHLRTVQLGMRPIAMSFHDLSDSDNT